MGVLEEKSDRTLVPSWVLGEWPEEAVAILMALWPSPKTASQIADAIGRELGIAYTKNAIIGKAHRLKLPPKNSFDAALKPSPKMIDARKRRY